MHLKVIVDGGLLGGNPGPGAWGGVFRLYKKHGGRLPISIRHFGFKFPCEAKISNNVAEYRAVISGMLTILEHYIDLDGLQSIDMFTDSKLIVKQVNGDWQAKNETMDRLRRIAMRLKNTIELDVKFNLKWASRNNTTAAHKLAEDIILDRSLKKYVS